MPDDPTPRPPDVIDGEVGRVRPAPRSPLDPDYAGRWPTALRPTPTRTVTRDDGRPRRLLARLAALCTGRGAA